MYISQENLIDSAIGNPSFVFTAAQEAANAPAILTAHTASSAQADFNVHKSEAQISHNIYEDSYVRIGILRSLEESGVVHIPTSRRYVLREIDDGEQQHVGFQIRKLLRHIRNVRLKG